MRSRKKKLLPASNIQGDAALIKTDVVKRHDDCRAAFYVHTIAAKRRKQRRFICESSAEKCHVLARRDYAGRRINSFFIIENLQVIKVIQVDVAADLQTDCEARDEQVFVTLLDCIVSQH